MDKLLVRVPDAVSYLVYRMITNHKANYSYGPFNYTYL
jgi:hypothetical protein